MTNSHNTITYSSLSIQVRLDGLSFFTQNPTTSEVGAYDIVLFEQLANATTLLTYIEEAFKSHPLLAKAYTKVTVIYDNDLYAVVPLVLFDKDRASDYLKFSTKILSTDFVAYDELTEQRKVVVYIPYTSVNNFFFDRFGDFEFYHGTTLLLKSLLIKCSEQDKARVFATIKKDSFDLVIIQNGDLSLINTYRITSPEDFLYYLLFAYEQLDLDPNEVPLELSGDVHEEHDIYRSAYKYVRYCTLLEPFSSIIRKEETLLTTLL